MARGPPASAQLRSRNEDGFHHKDPCYGWIGRSAHDDDLETLPSRACRPGKGINKLKLVKKLARRQTESFRFRWAISSDDSDDDVLQHFVEEVEDASNLGIAVVGSRPAIPTPKLRR